MIYDKQILAQKIADDPECRSGMWYNRVKAISVHLSVVDSLVEELTYWYARVPVEERSNSPFGIAIAGAERRVDSAMGLMPPQYSYGALMPRDTRQTVSSTENWAGPAIVF